MKLTGLVALSLMGCAVALPNAVANGDPPQITGSTSELIPTIPDHGDRPPGVPVHEHAARDVNEATRNNDTIPDNGDRPPGVPVHNFPPRDVDEATRNNDTIPDNGDRPPGVPVHNFPPRDVNEVSRNNDTIPDNGDRPPGVPVHNFPPRDEQHDSPASALSGGNGMEGSDPIPPSV